MLQGIVFEASDGMRRGEFWDDRKSNGTQKMDLMDEAGLERRGVRWYRLSTDDYITEVSGNTSNCHALAFSVQLKTQRGKHSCALTWTRT